MYRRITLSLPPATLEQLAELAISERRAVRDEAVVLLERALRREHVGRHAGQPLPHLLSAMPEVLA
jgi:hypothetical protein